MAQYYNYNGRRQGGFLDFLPQATKHLLIFNVLAYVATMINRNFMVGTFSMFFPTSPHFHFWQPFTYMFMHGSFMHLFANMWGLVMFGGALENSLGTKKYLILYFASGFTAMFAHVGVQLAEVLPLLNKISEGNIIAWNQYSSITGIPMLGASGAIYGVQIAFAMLYPNSVWTLMFPPISLKAKWFVLIITCFEVYCGVTGTAAGVAHFAHLGGALCGFLMIWYWRKKGKLWS